MTLCGRLCSTPWRPTSGSTSQLIGERIDEEERGLSSDASTETPTREVKDQNSTPAAVHITQSIRVSDRNEAVRSKNTQTGNETKVGLFRRTEAETEAGFQLSSSLSFFLSVLFHTTTSILLRLRMSCRTEGKVQRLHHTSLSDSSWQTPVSLCINTFSFTCFWTKMSNNLLSFAADLKVTLRSFSIPCS